jgi:hypothetical protein
MNHIFNLRTQVLTIFDLSFDESVDKANISGGSNTLDTSGGGGYVLPCPGSRPENARRSFSYGGVVRVTEQVAGHEYGTGPYGGPACIDWLFPDDEPYSERKKPWWNPF